MNPGPVGDRQLCYPSTIAMVSHLISLSKFNIPLIGTFTWPTPPGHYRTTTCRGRELNYGSHTYFFDHTRTWRASPDEWSAQCRGHLRDNTHEAHTQVIPTRRIWNDDYDGQMIFRGPWGPKVSWHLSVRWGKTPKKPHPGNLSLPGIEPEPAAWQASMLPLAPQRWTSDGLNGI